MSDFTQVNANAMTTGIEDLAQAHRQLTQNLDELDGQLKSSLAQWDGEARNAYHTAQAQWNAAANHMSSVVSKMNGVLTQITADYGSTEKMIQSRFSG